MKQYYGNYLGVVISGGEKDPEGRGRTQVFIPHIMPALYEGWNKEGRDIQFDIVGEGLPTALSPEIIDRLQKILPWAECAAPIVGASPSVKNGSEINRNIGGAIIGGLGPVIPFGTPKDNAEWQSLTSVAARQQFAAGKCGTAVGEILERVYGYSEKQIRDGSPTGRRDGKEFNKIMPSLGWRPVRIARPEDAPPGSVISYGAVPGNKWGHVEWVGINSKGQKAFYFGLGGSDGVTAPGGGSRVSSRNLGGFNNIAWIPPGPSKDAPAPENQALARSVASLGLNPSAVPHDSANNLKPDGSNPTVEYSEKLATDRQAQFGQELQDPAVLNRLRYLATREVGLNPNDQTAWMETAINRAQVLGVSLSDVINSSYYPDRTMTGFPRWITNDQQRQEATNATGTAINNILKGSNLTNYATDNASNQPNNTVARNRINKGVTGTWFQNGTPVSPEKANELTSLNKTPDNGSQFYYRDSQYAAAAEKYVQENNIGQTFANSSVVVQNPTPYQMQSGPSTNNQARGMFGYASEGTTVWVFFREGNPQFPVYFAASYGQREWQNMYQYSSPGIGAGAGPGGATPGTEVCDMRLYGGGQRSVQVSEESGLEPDFIHQIYSTNGSNLTFTKDHTEFNSIYDHVNRVMGDHHDITEANKETRVRGDMNTYAEQDVYVTIGNWSDEAVAASDEIQQYLNEAMEIKSKSGNGGSEGAAASSEENTITLEAAREATQAEINRVSEAGANIQNAPGRFALFDPQTGNVTGFTNDPPPGFGG